MDERKSAERRGSNAARETASRASETAREATDRLQESTLKATEGFRDYQLKILSAAQANLNAIFEYAQDVVQAQSMSEVMELSAAHSRRQLETIAQQSREIANAAQKLAGGAAGPLTSGFGSKFNPMS
jgi:phasin